MEIKIEKKYGNPEPYVKYENPDKINSNSTFLINTHEQRKSRLANKGFE